MVLCRETVESITDAREGTLPTGRRLLVKLHLSMCPHCQRYAQQMETTIDALGKIEPEPSTPPYDVLLAALRKETADK